MHRHKIFPPLLLILSFISFLLAAPVEVRQGCTDMADVGVPEEVIFIPESGKRNGELEKRWDEPWKWQKRATLTESNGPSVGGPPADQELATNSPLSPQTGTNGIQRTASSVPSPKIQHPAIENYYASGESGPRPDSIVIMSHPPPPQAAPFPWDPTNWSTGSLAAEPKEDFISKAKSFFAELFHKLTFWAGSGCLRCFTG